MTAYDLAKEAYAKFGVDTEAALARVAKIPLSIHCWQGDDVRGFESRAALSGGIQVTGNYPGAARTPEELMRDFDLVLSLVPGKKRISLHAIYAITDTPVPRDEIRPEHFAAWVDYAKEREIGIDFNPTCFSHPMAADGLTLSHPDEKVRAFWVRHVRACRRIAAEIGKAQGSPCLCNLWIPDGLKDNPADRLSPRLRLKESLDRIYADSYDRAYLLDAVESKVFGIGVESYTVGSSEFYLNYAAKNDLCCLLDNGHYHPTENVADKISAMLAFYDKVALHVTRSVRWDSDHVVAFDDATREIAAEIVKYGADDRVLIGLDYFDASINRIAAWVIGARNMQKALLAAALSPTESLARAQEKRDYTYVFAMSEEIKSLPFGAVFDEYLRRENTPGSEWFGRVKEYEATVLKERN